MIAAFAASLLPGRVEACGVWTLNDLELHREFRFQASGVRIPNLRSPQARDFLLFRIEAPRGDYRLEVGGKTKLDFDGDTLRLGGKPVGALTETGVEVAGVGYRIDVRRSEPPDERAPFRFRVERAAMLVAEGSAMSFYGACTAGEDEQQSAERKAVGEERDVRIRLALFVAWRQLLKPATLPTSR